VSFGFPPLPGLDLDFDQEGNLIGVNTDFGITGSFQAGLADFFSEGFGFPVPPIIFNPPEVPSEQEIQEAINREIEEAIERERQSEPQNPGRTGEEEDLFRIVLGVPIGQPLPDIGIPELQRVAISLGVPLSSILETETPEQPDLFPPVIGPPPPPPQNPEEPGPIPTAEGECPPCRPLPIPIFDLVLRRILGLNIQFPLDFQALVQVLRFSLGQGAPAGRAPTTDEGEFPPTFTASEPGCFFQPVEPKCCCTCATPVRSCCGKCQGCG